MCTPIWEKENGITAQINFTVRNSHGGWPLHKMHSRFQQMLFPPFVIIRNELSIRFDINTMIMTILYDHDHKVKRALHYYDIHCVDDNLIWPLNLTIINGQPWEHWHWPSPSLWTWPLNMTIEYDHRIWPLNLTIEYDHHQRVAMRAVQWMETSQRVFFSSRPECGTLARWENDDGRNERGDGGIDCDNGFSANSHLL